MVKFAGHFASACWWATFKCQDWWNAKRCCVKKPRSRRSQEEPGCTNFNRLLQCVKDVAENHKIVTLGCSSSKTVELCGQVFNLPSLEDLGLDRQRWLTPRIVEGFQVPWLGLDERSTPTIISRVKGFLCLSNYQTCDVFFSANSATLLSIEVLHDPKLRELFHHIIHLDLTFEECLQRRTAQSPHNPNPLHPQDVVDLASKMQKTRGKHVIFWTKPANYAGDKAVREWSTLMLCYIPWIAGDCHFANDQKNIRFTMGCILSFCKSHLSSVFIWTIQLNRCGPLFLLMLNWGLAGAFALCTDISGTFGLLGTSTSSSPRHGWQHRSARSRGFYRWAPETKRNKGS